MTSPEIGQDLSYSTVLITFQPGDKAPGVGIGYGDYIVGWVNYHFVHIEFIFLGE
ncbi:hypothetical protein F090043F1_14860 [Parabacteroides goldsteinii]